MKHRIAIVSVPGLLASLLLAACGGGSDSGSPTQAELFDLATVSFVVTSNMTTARESYTATLLHSGAVLITGGANGTLGYSATTVLATAELFQ